MKTEFSKKLKNTALAVQGTVLGLCYPTYASAGSVSTPTGGGVTIKDVSNTSLDSLIGQVILQVFTLMRYVGLILFIFGIYQLYMSFKDDNPDGKVKAITLLVTSVGLMTVKSILTTVGLIG